MYVCLNARMKTVLLIPKILFACSSRSMMLMFVCMYVLRDDTGLLAYTVQGRDVNLDIKRVVGYRQFWYSACILIHTYIHTYIHGSLM